MIIRKYIHSCLLLEQNGERLLIDPWTFTFNEGLVKPEDFTDIKTIIITHKHTDHCDVNAIKSIASINHNIYVLCNSQTAENLNDLGIPTTIHGSGTHDTGIFKIYAIAADHEPTLLEKPQNTGYLINNIFLHPGDSLSEIFLQYKNIEALALPTAAPWVRRIEIADFGKSMNPKNIIAIHDGFLKNPYFSDQNNIYKNFF